MKMVLQGFEKIFEKYLKGNFGMMQRDVRCIQNGHCPLQEKKLVMHFGKRMRKWQKCNLQTKGFWSKEGMAYFYINGVCMT